MGVLPRAEAAARLKDAIRTMAPDDLREVYNDLFPQCRLSEEEAFRDPAGVAKRVAHHLGRGLEIEEILDLWPVVFPQERRLRYDEESGGFHFADDVALAWQDD